MGMFDTIIYDCPSCGELASSQTKCGPCELNEYNIYDMPITVAVSFAEHGVPYPCEHCGKTPKFKLPQVPQGSFQEQYEHSSD